MDVRSGADTEVELAHRDTVRVWWLVRPRELRPATEGGFLELVSEFDVAPGSEVSPHEHPTHEWYYVLSGTGSMIIDGETRDVAGGDLVYIPPNLVHSLHTTGDVPIRCLCFAIAEPNAPEIDYALN